VWVFSVSVPYDSQVDSRGQWEITPLPARGAGTLAVRKDEKTTVLNLAQAQWSHARP